MEVMVKLTGTNLFGGQEVICCSSRELYGIDDLDYFNSRSEYYAVSVKKEVIDPRLIQP